MNNKPAQPRELTHAQLKAALRQATRLDKAQNGPVYPEGSLHAKGIALPGCKYCQRVIWIKHALGLRKSPKFSKGDLRRATNACQRFEVEDYEHLETPEAIVNDW